MTELNGANIARNLVGHSLTTGALTAFIWVLCHIDGWFGRHPADSLPAARTTAVLWHVVPVMVVVILTAAFIIPKKDKHTYGGQVFDSMRYSHDDPYHLVRPSRLVGVVAVLGVASVWGEAIVAALRTWIG